ncbi:MAG: IPT/TIG domain-containing protein [Rufibacter sp.]
MKYFYNVRTLLLALVVVSFGFLTSCDDEEDELPNGGKVELLSFGPTGAKHGEEIRFIGHNLDKVESIVLPGATVAKAQFVDQTSTLIRLVVPQEAIEGKVTLKVTGGEDVVSKTDLSFEVPITITSVTAQAKPGTNITITGTKLNWVEGVVFEQDTVKEFVTQSATEVVLTVPMTAKTGKLLILGGGTEPTFIETENELVVTLPAVSGMTPATISNGANLTITGTNLDLVKEVIFTGVGAARTSSFVSQTATQLVVKVPNNASKGKITLVALSGVEVPTTQEITLVLPAVTALDPASVKHSENLTLTGTNLDLVRSIKFPGGTEVQKATFATHTATQIVVAVPNNATNGALKLVSNSGVEVTTTQNMAITLPAITTVSPSPVDPGQNLTINGTNLDLVKSVEFKGGTKVSTFVSQTPTKIVVTVPATAQRGVLTLHTIKDFVVTTTAQATIVLPALTAVTPEPVVAGNYLTLTGTDLNLVKSVVFNGGATVSSFVAQNSTQIVLVVPTAAKSGEIKFITTSDYNVSTGKQAQIGTAVPNITTYIYENSLNTTWDKWNGWGTPTQDLANTENPSRGATAVKLVYNDAYGAFQLHPQNANAFAGYTHLVLYVRGTINSRMAVQAKNSGGTTGSDFAFDVVAGEYKKIEVPISALGDFSGGLSELYFKNYGTNPNTVYIDDIGLR